MSSIQMQHSCDGAPFGTVDVGKREMVLSSNPRLDDCPCRPPDELIFPLLSTLGWFDSTCCIKIPPEPRAMAASPLTSAAFGSLLSVDEAAPLAAPTAPAAATWDTLLTARETILKSLNI
mmetsp:Transcript_33324/g.53552  ORF Transcript_33324/g.53552 Transcript_33324/m.53552 type:complete len:120 (-) Transcript_33324:199-558(-)